MKILFLTLGTEIMAGSRTRVYQYLPFLKKAGFSCHVVPYNATFQLRHSLKPATNPVLRGFYRWLGRLHHFLRLLEVMVRAPFYHILFIQKVAIPVPIQRVLKRLNSSIVFDFDDSTFYLNNDPNMVSHTFTSTKLIIVENEYNRAYAAQFNRNVLVVTGPIDTDRYHSRGSKTSGEVVIGWIGHPQHVNYLLPLEDVFRFLCQKYADLRIMLIGSGPINMDGVNLVVREWSLDTEVDDLHRFDIGIMPLDEKDGMALGKGGYKLLQYMSLGIPCVASPVEINKELIRDGENGYLAATREEWIDRLSRLIEDEGARCAMGERGRRLALERYSFLEATPRLVNSLRTLVEETGRER